MADSTTISMRPSYRDALVIPGAQAMEFDAIISEEHSQKLTVTQNPTELGTNISDHCFVDETKLTLVGSVADILMPNAADGYDSSIGRSNSAYQKLCLLQASLANNTLPAFDIVTSVQLYEDMVMTEIKMKRDKTTSMLGRFEMSFVHIVVVATQTTSYTAIRPPVKRSVAPKKDSGTKTPTIPSFGDALKAGHDLALAAGKGLYHFAFN